MMSLRQHLKDQRTMMRVGMCFLILASLSRWFLHPSAGISEDWVDGITGLLYGISIASLLVSVRLRAGRAPSDMRADRGR